MITFEIIIFIGAILFGIYLYQVESKNNGLYRSINKLMYSEDVRMKANNRKGFVHQQDFLIRLVYIGLFFLIFLLLSILLFPFSILSVQYYFTLVVGTLVGTYIGSTFLGTKELVEDGADSVEDIVSDTLEKGKDIFNDIKERVGGKETPKETPKQQAKEVKETPKEAEKSARDRLKDKGLL